ncbi:alpha/beta fold hydrolase, partial [Streptococcus salivarius]
IRYLNELSEFSTEEYLKNMQVATLLIYGTEDTIISNKRSQEMDEMLPNSQVFTMLNQGHYPYLTAPEEFNTVISNFFKED